jgi:ATP phosphoribosyltransferase regulatory subunit
MLGLRADHTPQVARIDAHLLNREGVVRLCYCGSVLHTVPAGMTKMREPIQIGAEMYGHAGLEADAEIVGLMIDALKVAGLDRIHIDLGHPGIFRALTEKSGLDAEDSEALFHAVQQKDAPRALELGGEAVAALTELAGPPDVIVAARKRLPSLPAVGLALNALERLARQAVRSGVEVSVDLAELGGFNYESGIVFAAFIPGSPDAIARGGRYDEVGASFGRARPATGFTMDLRQLAARVPARVASDRILAPSLEDAALQAVIAQLRAEGHIVVVQMPGSEMHDAELGCEHRLEKKDGTWRVT